MIKVHGRHGARWVAVQGLYAWQLSGLSLSKIEADLLAKPFQLEKYHTEKLDISFDKAYLHELLFAVQEQYDDLDQLMLPHLDRPINELQPIEHAILWIALYELKDRIEIPYKVIINEAILLAKQFGAQDSHKFVNGVLDEAAKELRAREQIKS